MKLEKYFSSKEFQCLADKVEYYINDRSDIGDLTEKEQDICEALMLKCSSVSTLLEVTEKKERGKLEETV